MAVALQSDWNMYVHTHVRILLPISKRETLVKHASGCICLTSAIKEIPQCLPDREKRKYGNNGNKHECNHFPRRK